MTEMGPLIARARLDEIERSAMRRAELPRMPHSTRRTRWRWVLGVVALLGARERASVGTGPLRREQPTLDHHLEAAGRLPSVRAGSAAAPLVRAKATASSRDRLAPSDRSLVNSSSPSSRRRPATTPSYSGTSQG